MPRADAPSDDAQAGHTQQGHAFDVVGPLIDKMLTMGRVDEAERLLRSPIQRVLSHAEQGLPVDEAVTSAAATFAVRIAEASGTAHWIDLTFRVHSALGRTLPLPVVDELYRVLRGVRGIDRATLRNYIEQLESRARTMAPTERFALKRIVGLRPKSPMVELVASATVRFIGTGEAFNPHLPNTSVLYSGRVKLLLDCGYGVPTRFGRWRPTRTRWMASICRIGTRIIVLAFPRWSCGCALPDVGDRCA